MSLSSIHIQKANPNCFKHNAREEKHPANTINKDHTDKNICDIKSEEAQKAFNDLFQERIKKATSNRKADKTNCLVEAVVNIEPDTTQEQLKNLSNYIEKEFKFTLLQTAIHKDEGHIKDDKLEINYHAHLVFATIDENGKQMYRREHINRDKLSNLQDNTAEILGMERGKENSTAKRLSHKDFKEHKKRSEPLEQKINSLELANNEIIKLATENDKTKSEELENIRKQYNELIKQFEDIENDRNRLKMIEKELKEENKKQRQELKENGAIRSDYAQLESNNKLLKEFLKESQKELKQYKPKEKSKGMEI